MDWQPDQSGINTHELVQSSHNTLYAREFMLAGIQATEEKQHPRCLIYAEVLHEDRVNVEDILLESVLMGQEVTFVKYLSA